MFIALEASKHDSLYHVLAPTWPMLKKQPKTTRTYEEKEPTFYKKLGCNKEKL